MNTQSRVTSPNDEDASAFMYAALAVMHLALAYLLRDSLPSCLLFSASSIYCSVRGWKRLNLMRG